MKQRPIPERRRTGSGGGSTHKDQAESLAIAAVAFLAADDERLGRFLALTGLDPMGLRAAAAQPGFLAGVLDHLGSDETLLLAFATHAGIDPAEVDRARVSLSGQGFERET